MGGYSRSGGPEVTVRPAAVWGDRLLTEPAPRAVEDAIRSVIQAHSHEFDAALAPLGYSVFDVAKPSYEVIVPADECPIFVALERKYRRSEPVET